jgi:hypothetical protein
MNKANECTCPSGDGSLVHPCPAHPAVEQVGGDERAAFELFVRKHCGMPAHIAVNWDAKFTNDAWEGWKARAALAQPSPPPHPASELDFSRPLETENGDPVKWICADVIEYKSARVCVAKDTGLVYSSPYIGLKIRNVMPEQAEAERPEGPTEDELEAAGLGYPLHKEEAVKLWYSGFRSEVITVLEAWEAIGHDIGMNPSKGELLDSLRNMAAICNAHGNDMPAQSAIDQRQVIADAITGALAFGAQAQHSVPEVSGIGRDFAYPRSVVLYLRTEPTDDDLRAIHDGLRSLAAAPGKEVGHE